MNCSQDNLHKDHKKEHVSITVYCVYATDSSCLSLANTKLNMGTFKRLCVQWPLISISLTKVKHSTGFNIKLVVKILESLCFSFFVIKYAYYFNCFTLSFRQSVCFCLSLFHIFSFLYPNISCTFLTFSW